MDKKTFLENFSVIADAPNGIQQLRNLIYDLAVEGQLMRLNTKFRESNSAEPDHRRRIKDVVKMFNGNSTSAGEKARLAKNESGIPYIATKDIEYGFQPVNYQTGLNVDIADAKYKIAPKGAVLICLEGGSAGRKMALLDRDVAFGNKLFANVCSKELNPKFLLITFLSTSFQSQFKAGMSGIIGGISKARFSEIEIAVPSIERQVELVAKVEELMALCDELESEKTKRETLRTEARASAIDAISTATTPEELSTAWSRISNNWDAMADSPGGIEKLRELVIALSVCGQLSNKHDEDESVLDLLQRISDHLPPHPVMSEIRFAIPPHWKWVPLASIAEHQLGKMLNTSKMKGVRRKYLRSVNVLKSGIIDLSDVKEMLIPEIELDKYSVKNGDLFVNEGGDVGRNAIWLSDDDEPFAFQNQLHRLRPLGGISSRYLQLILRNAKSSGVIAEMSSGVTIQHFSATAIRKLACPIPPVEEQQRIVAKVDELMALCDELEETLTSRTEIESAFALASSQLLTI